MKYCFTLLALLAVGFGTLCCQPKKKATLKTKQPTVFDVIYLKRTPCMGKCPVYEAWFKSDNRLVYKGEKHMSLIGNYEYVIPPQLLKNLIYEAKKAGIQKLPADLGYAPDLPGLELMVIMDGKKKVVKTEGMMPENLKNYVKLLHEEVAGMIAEQEAIPLKE